MDEEVRELNEWFDQLAQVQQEFSIVNVVKKEPVIDERVKSRLWKLNETEFNNLEQSIITEGCRDALVLWGDILIDGHNRYEVCKRNNVPYRTVKKEFNDIEEVLLWIDMNQLSRRNLTDEQRTILIGRIYKSNKKQVGQHGEMGQNGPFRSKPTYEKIADELKIGVNTVKRAEKYVNAIEDIERSVGKEITDKIVSGDLKISKQDIIKIGELDPFEQEKVITKIQEEGKNVATIIKKGEIDQVKKEIKEGKIELPEGKFQVIMMDVPWPYNTEYDESNIMGRSACPYPEMQLPEIYNLDIPADDNCVLFFWTTHKFLEESFSIIKHYGFEYKATLVWDKEKMGIGKTLRLQCEFCLVCFKGQPLWNLTNVRDILREPRREHSRKPEGLYEIINENLVGNKLDYFSREEREGWLSFGTTKDKKENESNEDK